MQQLFHVCACDPEITYELKHCARIYQGNLYKWLKMLDGFTKFALNTKKGVLLASKKAFSGAPFVTKCKVVI